MGRKPHRLTEPPSEALHAFSNVDVVVNRQWDTRKHTHISLKYKHLRFWSCSWYFLPQIAIILPLK